MFVKVLQWLNTHYTHSLSTNHYELPTERNFLLYPQLNSYHQIIIHEIVIATYIAHMPAMWPENLIYKLFRLHIVMVHLQIFSTTKIPCPTVLDFNKPNWCHCNYAILNVAVNSFPLIVKIALSNSISSLISTSFMLIS